MSARDEGGPAFPFMMKNPTDSDMPGMLDDDPVPPHTVRYHSGLSTRQYFAVRAPEAPDWFRYSPKDPRPPQFDLSEPEKELNTLEQDELRAWKDGSGMDFSKLSANVRAFMLRYQKAHSANENFQHWRMRNREEKYWAWRWYYADKMIEGSEK